VGKREGAAEKGGDERSGRFLLAIRGRMLIL
jgi:hypothetical protein